MEAFSKPNIGGGGADWISGQRMQGLLYFVKRFGNCTEEMFLSRRERNEPMMVNEAKFFPSNYTNQVVYLSTALLQSIVNICSEFFVMFLL